MSTPGMASARSMLGRMSRSGIIPRIRESSPNAASGDQTSFGLRRSSAAPTVWLKTLATGRRRRPPAGPPSAFSAASSSRRNARSKLAASRPDASQRWWSVTARSRASPPSAAVMASSTTRADSTAGKTPRRTAVREPSEVAPIACARFSTIWLVAKVVLPDLGRSRRRRRRPDRQGRGCVWRRSPRRRRQLPAARARNRRRS